MKKEICMEMPSKLKRDLSKLYSEQSKAFIKLMNGLEVFTPALRLESWKRYSALYYRKTPVVYIDLQHTKIVLGFFLKDIQEYHDLHREQFTHFPKWNTSRGGLIGFELGKHDDNLLFLHATASLLLVTSYLKRTGWPAKTCTLY
jgi:hypothetical protein